MVIHNIPPVYDENSRILILGSFPSVKSREQAFFYGHPQNRFWKMLAAVLNSEKPQTVTEKKALLLQNGIALWDVISSCEIDGSADASIKNVVPNDICSVLKAAPIEKIIVNGKTAEKYYNKFIFPATCIRAVCLPSTSPANARVTLETLTEIWKQNILPILQQK